MLLDSKPDDGGPASWTPVALWRERVPLKPASNMKVLTTGAALDVLGRDFHFRTRLLLERSGGRADDAATRAARITVVGDGDPSFGDPDSLASLRVVDHAGRLHRMDRPEALIDFWTEEVRARQIASIEELVVDGRIFDGEAYHPSWPTDGQALRPYCAEVWGLNFHANALRVLVRGRTPGPLSTVSVVPAYPGVEVRNDARVVSGGRKGTFVATRSPRSNRVVLSGGLVAGSTGDVDLSVHDAPSLFAGLLASRLEQSGVRVGRVRVAATDDPLPSGELVAVVETPLAVALSRANTDSSNLHAECLLKRMAAQARFRTAGATTDPPLASWRAGSSVLEAQVVARLGAGAADGFVFSDGSGLSHDNRVTTLGLASWTASVASDPTHGTAFIASLARAGDSGTVARRFAFLRESEVAVHCKTGYILGVSSLSGIAVGPGGDRVAFSIIGNGLEAGDRVARARALQEAIVLEIVRAFEAEAGRKRVP